ncbi:MAG: cation diffusion facilitator family transporter [Cocleimonas sp.]|jgi:cation diffusion facilitator family transporter
MNIKITRQARYEATRKVTLVGVVVNICLSLVQLIGGFFANSQALIADGVHTLSDLLSDFVVLFAAKIANQEADEDHPYGHGRFETLATVILGLALTGVAVGIIINAATRLLNVESLAQPTSIALLFAAIGIIAKEGLYHYTMHVATRFNSKLLEANAWHHRSDAISSLVVAIGVAGSVIFELPWLDAVAAIFVALMIFYMGFRLILDSTMELVDTAWDANKTNEMKQFISEIEGVEHMHMLRTRKMGNDVLADVHLQVNPYISVSEGHYIAEYTMSKLRKEFPELSDLTVHIDPEDDEDASLSKALPSRKQLMSQLYPIMQKHSLDESIHSINLHYIKGKIEVELVLSKLHHDGILAAFKSDGEALDDVRVLNILNLINE